ncbi:hypothetical protein ES332_A10G070900v1, partial [Gossypium tomentosum]
MTSLGYSLGNCAFVILIYIICLAASDILPSDVYADKVSWICGGELDLGSSCIQRIILDVTNVLFLCLFYFLLLLSVNKSHMGESNRKDLIPIHVSICSAFISLVYFGTALWDIIIRDEGLNDLEWLVYLVRGVIWMSVSVSLRVRTSKSIKIVISVWWKSFSLLVSAINIRLLFQTHNLPFFDLIQWPVNIMLLVFGFRNLISSSDTKCSEDHQVLYEPLFKAKKAQVGIGRASFLSKLNFSWINPLFSLGHSKLLTLEDISSLVDEDEASLAHERFAQAWESLVRGNSLSNSKNLVLRALAKVYFKENVLIGICAFLRIVCVVSLPLLLYAFVDYSNHSEENRYEGLTILGCLVICKVVESLSQRRWFFSSRRRRHSTGEIVNNIAVDAYRLGEFPWWLHSAWSLVLQLFMSIGILFYVVGLGALPGLVPSLICGVLNVPFANVLQKCQSQFMVAQDERLRLTSEVLNNMKIIKLQSWEEKFKNMIETRRENEFKWLAKEQISKAYGTVLFWISPTIISSVIFLGCAYLGSAPLNASTIFTVLGTLRSMGEPVTMIPGALSVMMQVKVSTERINAFLLGDELNSEEPLISMQSSDKSVVIQAGNFSWDTELTVATLRDVNLEIKKGQKIAVCGPVGAGKSSILHVMLGEIPKISGTVYVTRSIAYVSQTSWIQSGTIRDNILDGKPMDEERYKRAIKSCALDKDIDNFAHGDLTEIGQRGINMSGGQKQRIQLARAVYNDADIYLLDDPFSAVDAQTAAVLFNVMDGGSITQIGSYTELLMSGTAFEELVNAHRDAMTIVDPLSNENKEQQQGTDTLQAEEYNKCYSTQQKSEGEISALGLPGVQLTEEEEKGTGDFGWRPFLDYIVVSKGYLFLSLAILSQFGFVIFQAAATYWLAISIQIPKISSGLLIGVYTGISTLSAVFCILASKAFFYGFINSIFKAPMLFFDSTPVGRILTRASSDLSILDFDLPLSIGFVAAGSIELVAAIGVIAFVTWEVLIVAILVMIAVTYIQRYYLASARELIRINGTTKAPVMNYAAETSIGVVTIRAFNMVDGFFKNYLKLVDTDATLFFLCNAATEWLILRIEALQNKTIFASVFILILLPKGYVPPGLAGLSLSYAFSITSTQVFWSRWHCNLSNYMISVERIKQFMCIPSGPPATIDDKMPSPSWPSAGRIELQELKIRYRPNAPLVLKGITCTFKEGTRVGVVGRTGSGKSTLIGALFRLVEPAEGKIFIDGLDICSIGLKDLRMKLSIIPQEPTLFRGSVRTNLDPLGLYTDGEIWKALEKCQLKATISSLPNTLDSSVSDEGENWSVGQRQLFCLGRVLLKRKRILVLDEATAPIDSATDAILQRIIRQEFSECTVIKVAHRVPTVIDSDMVMVLSYGKLIEYDEPARLMGIESGFSKLVAEHWSSCRK